MEIKEIRKDLVNIYLFIGKELSKISDKLKEIENAKPKRQKQMSKV